MDVTYDPWLMNAWVAGLFIFGTLMTFYPCLANLDAFFCRSRMFYTKNEVENYVKQRITANGVEEVEEQPEPSRWERFMNKFNEKMRWPYMIMAAGAHQFDIYSDLNYIMFVPAYAIEFKIIMILSFAMPILVMFILYKCFASRVVTRCEMVIFYLGLAPIYYELKGSRLDEHLDVSDSVMAL